MVRLRVGHQHSQFWPILARFLDYYSVFGSRRDFHDRRTPGCIYVSLINTRSFGRFWPVSWTITLFLGPGVISMINEPWGAFTCRSSRLAVFVDSHKFRGLLLDVLGSKSDFCAC